MDRSISSLALSPLTFRPAAMLACALLPLALAGCGIEGYRSLTGVNRNDPDPQTALFTGNLAEAETRTYPNLASVPPPPTRASTAAERKKLADTLVAERAAAEASAKVPEGLAPAGPVKSTDKTTGKNAAMPGRAVPGGAVPGAASATAAAASGPGKGGLPGEGKTAANQTPHRRADEPPEPGPRDSAMQMPEIRSTPEPEATRAPPAPAALGRVTPPATFAAPPAEAAAIPPPPPSAPDLAAAPPPPVTAGAPAPAPRVSPLASTVATLVMPDGATLDGTGQQQVARVVALYKEKPGTIRVVARTPPPAPGTDPLAGYHTALGGAQAVADALKQAGIPANKIVTEASPNVGRGGSPGGGANSGRIEIQLAP